MESALKTQLKKNVPNSELHFFIKGVTGEEPRGYVTKEALIERLADLTVENPSLIEDVNELLIKYRYAGRGSVSWSIPTNIHTDDNESGEEIRLTKEDIERLIISNTNSNPFNADIRPLIDVKPALNRSRWLRDDLLNLEFVYADRTQMVEENYEIKEIKPTRRASILIRILGSSFIFESRANFNKALLLHGMASDMLNVDSEILNFDYNDVESLKMILNAQKKAARHKMLAGDFDTVEVTASPIVQDLDDSEEYKTYFDGDELRKARYRFKYVSNTGAQTDVTMYISHKGSIWFMSDVPEEVIEYVFSGIREVKRI